MYLVNHAEQDGGAVASREGKQHLKQRQMHGGMFNYAAAACLLVLLEHAMLPNVASSFTMNSVEEAVPVAR